MSAGSSLALILTALVHRVTREKSLIVRIVARLHLVKNRLFTGWYYYEFML